MALISLIEPKNINEAIIDEHWIIAMQEELNQFERNQVQELVDRPNDHPIIGTKWVFRNKLDEHGIVIRNKARLVAKRYNQEEGQIMKKLMRQQLDLKLLECYLPLHQ